MNKRHYEHTLPNIRGSLSNTYDTVRLGKRNPLEMPYLNRKFVCSAETTHDAGKVDGSEESEQVKDDNPLLPAAQPHPASAESGHMAVYLRSERMEDLFCPFILHTVRCPCFR